MIKVKEFVDRKVNFDLIQLHWYNNSILKICLSSELIFINELQSSQPKDLFNKLSIFQLLAYYQFWYCELLFIHFRLFNLCTIIYKIVFNAIVSRFQVLRTIIEGQSAFILGILISNNIIMAYEVIHSRVKGVCLWIYSFVMFIMWYT